MTVYERIGIQLRQSAQPGDTVFLLLTNMVHAAMTWRIRNADMRPAVDIAKQLPDSGWAEANEAADRAMHGWIALIYHASARKGVTRPDIDIDLASHALYAMIEATLSTLDVSTPSREVAHIAEQVTLLQWHAIYAIPPDDSPLIGDALPNFTAV